MKKLNFRATEEASSHLQWSDNSHPVPWEDCRRDFLGGLLRLSPKVRATLAQGSNAKVQLPLSVGGPELRQRVS